MSRKALAAAAAISLAVAACSGDPAQPVGPGAVSLGQGNATGNLGNPRVLPPNSHAFGKTYGEWSAEWWRYVFSVPVRDNPLFDETGANCAVGQTGHVFFLVGVFNETGEAVRTECVVPTGTALFFPILNAECSNVEGDGTTDAELRECAAAIADEVDVATLAVEIDGVPIGNLASYRVQSPAFNFTLAEDNILGAPGGSCVPSGGSCVPNLAVADGYYLLLPPLPPGTHTIHFHGSAPAFDFTLDIVYELTVVPGAKKAFQND